VKSTFSKNTLPNTRNVLPSLRSLEILKSYKPEEFKLQLWLVFKLFSRYVPVPNGELELEVIAALFDQLTALAEGTGQLKSINLQEKGEERV
jgi:hypothetical protein